jgi:hypothetical protein
VRVSACADGEGEARERATARRAERSGASAVRGMAYVKGSRQLQRTCLRAALGGLMIVCMTYVVLHMLYCILVIRQALHSSRSGFHAPLLSPAMQGLQDGRPAARARTLARRERPRERASVLAMEMPRRETQLWFVACQPPSTAGRLTKAFARRSALCRRYFVLWSGA